MNMTRRFAKRLSTVVSVVVLACCGGSPATQPAAPGGGGGNSGGAAIQLSAPATNVTAGQDGFVDVTLTRTGNVGAVEISLENGPAGMQSEKVTFDVNTTRGRIRFSVPATSAPGSGPVTVRGSAAGGVTATAIFALTVAAQADVIVSPDTRVMDAAARAALISIDDAGTLRFSATSAPALQPGNVVVSEPSKAAPYGFLRRVVSVDRQGDVLVVTTKFAKLQEAVYQGSLKLSRHLSPDALVPAAGQRRSNALLGTGGPYDLHATVDATLGDPGNQLRATGTLDLTIGTDFSLGLHYSFPASVSINAGASFGVNQKASIQITGDGHYSSSKEVTITVFHFTPIVIFLGPVPVVFIPRVPIVFGVRGAVDGHFGWGANEEFNFLAGVSVDSDGWHDIWDYGLKSSSTPVTFTANLTASGYVTARPEVMIYGLLGPRGALEGSIDLKAQIPGKPIWQLDGKMHSDFGFDCDVLDLHYHADLLNQGFHIADAPPVPPSVSIAAPVNGAKVGFGGLHETTFKANANDPQDGPSCCSIVWTSDKDGKIGEGAVTAYTFSNPGVRTITVTATNSLGLTAQSSVTIEAVSAPPSAQITSPPAGATLYRGIAAHFAGSGKDAALADIACTSLTWTTDVAGDPTATGCTVDLTFGSAGDRTVTLTARDVYGGSATASVLVHVTPPPAAPVARIDQPLDRQSFFPNSPMTLSGSATTSDGSTATFVWSVTWAGASEKVIGPGATRSWTPSADVPKQCGGRDVQLLLRATDGAGRTSAPASVTITIAFPPC